MSRHLWFVPHDADVSQQGHAQHFLSVDDMPNVADHARCMRVVRWCVYMIADMPQLGYHQYRFTLSSPADFAGVGGRVVGA